jgi:hypothetical protein
MIFAADAPVSSKLFNPPSTLIFTGSGSPAFLLTGEGKCYLHFQIAIDINLIARIPMIRQLNGHLTVPRHATAHGIIDRFRQQTGTRRLPAGVHSNVDQKAFSLGGGKIEIQRLIKPAGFQGSLFRSPL